MTPSDFNLILACIAFGTAALAVVQLLLDSPDRRKARYARKREKMSRRG